MERKSIWLVLFAVVALVAAYLWWSGGPAPQTEDPSDPVADSSLSDPDAPALGTGKEQIRPSVPGAREEAAVPDARSPHVQTAPPPGLTSPPPTYESFNAPNQANPNAEPPAPSPGDPPPSAFEPIPPQAFENPDFVTPPPPPPQFENEPPPFESDAPPPNYDTAPPNYDPPQDSGDDFIPPSEPEGY